MKDRDYRRERSGGRVVVAVVLGLALLLGGGYAAAYAMAGDKVPRGTTIAGVEVGGRTPADALRALRRGLAEQRERAITVMIDGRAQSIAPGCRATRVSRGSALTCVPRSTRPLAVGSGSPRGCGTPTPEATTSSRS